MVSDRPLVSVGIPTYNRPEGLKRTLQCITQQTYNHLDIIISDNCSPTPEVEAVAREFMSHDSRVRYVRQESNVGIFYNFKAVLDLAQGEYFTWAADDDARAPNFIEVCLETFSKSDKLLLVNSYSEVHDPKTGVVRRVDKGCTTLGLSALIRYKRYLSTIFTEQAATGDLIYGLMKRDALSQAMTVMEVLPWDHVLLARLALAGEFYTIPEPLMRSRLGGASRSNKTAARALLLDGTPAQQHPWWLREKYLQQTIQQASTLSPLEKLNLSAWSYTHYWLEHGIVGTIKGKVPVIHKIYRFIRYGER